jgi:uncharacterized cupredoxin-like copper-binding protein
MMREMTLSGDFMKALLLMLALALLGCATETAEQAPATEAPAAVTSLAVEDTAGEDQATDEHAEEDHEDMDMGHAIPDSDGAASRIVEIVMSEWSFDADSLTLGAGETVEFMVRNDGAIQHEFRITSGHEVETHMNEEHSDHAEEMEGILLVDPGETASMIVTFHEPGEWDVMACLLPDHFEAGMHAELEVTG